MSTPGTSLRSALARAGFADADTALDRISELGEQGPDLVPLFARTGDPDLALAALVDLAEAVDDRDDLLQAITGDGETGERLLLVLGASEALGSHLRRHPGHWHDLRDPHLASTRPTSSALRADLLAAVGAEASSPAPVATLPDVEAADALRVQYRRHLLSLCARDVAHGLGVADVAAELSDLAAGTLEAALAVARARIGPEADQARLAVIAMGKCGGHELNYVSDVDVIFVHAAAEGADDNAATRIATQLAAAMMQICSDHTREGTIWPVDANLRPEGSNGPLVRTLASHEGYYGRWAKTWEFQALLKARPVAGDLELGAAYREMIAPLVWSAAGRDGFVEDVQSMRRRVLDHIPADQAERQLKLGSGGLRDVEFAVQLLQMVHGRVDETVRAPGTLSAMAQLTRGGYIGREDGQAMHEAYAFLRTLEHRIQLHQLRRTHVLPTDEADLRRLGRSLGHLKDPVKELDKQWNWHRREVRRLHEKLFYRPLLSAVAMLPGDQARLSTDAAKERMAALGYLDPAAALRHLEYLTKGVTRTAKIQRQLLPAMLGWFGDSPDPDAGLFGFRRISEALGTTHWYLKLLRDEGEVAQTLARVLGTSRYATDLLEREPDGVKILGADLTPLASSALVTEMVASAGRKEGADAKVLAIRGVRRRELLRIATGELTGTLDVAEVGAGLSKLTDATLEATLAAAQEAVCQERKLDGPLSRMAIIAMGRYGGFELSYGSDADVMFVHAAEPGVEAQQATSYAQAVANELRRMLALPGTDPALEVDAALRPEGKQGPLVRTLESYAGYYRKWSAVWEFQALLRADAVVGDEDLRREFTELVDPLRFPAQGLSSDDVIEVRRIKARVDAERLPRGADPNTHLKLGRGGLADIEWTVQLLQMQHAGRHPELRTPRTLPALHAARDLELIDAADAEALEAAWRLVSATRNAITLVRGKASDQIPRDVRERDAVASVLGYRSGQSDVMVNDYLRTTRLAHGVVERVFWG
ncbi:bifunctional [glutamine synthetase] adenylyltransferase/[glutamine synthetase]-adenylyl-L-tyrosine phosphorylase [Nocardioides sp. AE5]|uniref:bifunctional [glutamine synthetase] adenylyltransferase/[glutamine synthetase]-adenylyl-L-tyrosine phosphorylase n=1 Tax=Nocardioides sp. AE5 TaxID=2962573 RepID=UPI00288274E1|nr:bifunctional [glutamine synthetase] adenylyltransferase/[glutamine synthetase]-adenylyl-L-tyrosine phosphorylase [Nocardioides sp. AE5]MDT0201633.1 bifunctional [glutamine synthetase] adenylyltransferase/[glutamine synthetase]-adenylyl-L-tyrosine phosphorylase [Nocardioides sp. AE5]